jgi:hypothetical protein
MSPSAHFAADYAEARAKFLDAATAARARLVAYDTPTRGPAGEALATDTAWVGPADAASVVTTISATHGVEGFCGSGIQVGSFAAGLAGALPKGTALLAVHAINPYGFAWLRRVTEENVDLNRNFVDHSKPLPENLDYDLLADAICPPAWDGATRAAARARLEEFAKERGAHALQKAVAGGQYRHPHGLFYGGSAPTRARVTLERILREQLGRARRLAVIDFHTGLGPYGYGEPIILARPDEAEFARAKDWWGDKVTSPAGGSSSSPDLHGVNMKGIARALPRTEITGCGLEYGTLPMREVIDSLRGDNWLHAHGDPGSPEAQPIKRAIRDAFYCDKDDWKAMVLEQGIERQRQALRGLAEG